MPESAVQTLILFFLMAAGFAGGKMKVLTEPVSRGLSRFLVDFILPCLVIHSMQRPLSPELRSEALGILGLSFAVYAAAFPLAFLYASLIRARQPARSVHAFVAVFSNVAFMGFPVLEAVFGRESLFYAAIYNIPFQLLAFSLGAEMIARGGGTHTKLSLRSFLSPAGIASFIGLGLFLANFSLPRVLKDSFRIMGDTVTPLSMILIGAVLARSEIGSALREWRLYATTLYRLILFPLALYAVLRMAGFSGLLLGIPVIIAAMPAAANSTLLSEAYGGDSRSASALVFVSTLISLVTIPLLANRLFGV